MPIDCSSTLAGPFAHWRKVSPLTTKRVVFAPGVDIIPVSPQISIGLEALQMAAGLASVERVWDLLPEALLQKIISAVLDNDSKWLGRKVRTMLCRFLVEIIAVVAPVDPSLLLEGGI